MLSSGFEMFTSKIQKVLTLVGQGILNLPTGDHLYVRQHPA